MKPCSEVLDPRIRRTRQLLYEALITLMAEKNFETISVQDVAERSTVNRATVYDHFPDKFALLEGMIGDQFKNYVYPRITARSTVSKEGLLQLMEGLCDFLLQLGGQCKKHRRQFEPISESVIKSDIAALILEGLQKKGQPANEALLKSTMVAWLIYGAAKEWIRLPSKPRITFAHSMFPMVAQILRRKIAVG